MAQKLTTKSAQRDVTRAKIVGVGRALFAQHGYAQTSTEEVVRQAGLTRGALYHHFPSKEKLFEAVLEEVQRDVTRRIDQAVHDTADNRVKLLAGCRAFLEACLDPGVQRVMLLDGQAVVGWEVWRQLKAQYAMHALREGLDLLAAGGHLGNHSPEAVTHLLSGALTEAALWVAQAPDPHAALVQAMFSVEEMLAALTVSPKQLSAKT